MEIHDGGGQREANAHVAPGEKGRTFAPSALKINRPPWIRHASGSEAVRTALVTSFGSVEDRRPEITTVVADTATWSVLLGRETARIRQTDEAYAMEFVEKFTFRHGRLASVQIIAARR